MNMRTPAFTLLFFIVFSCTLLPQGALLLVGGGTENYNDWSDAPYRWFAEHAPNRKILVLHYADTTSWFSGYFPSLGASKVSNLSISTAAAANDSAVYKFILQHDGIFLRGGDQAQYAAKWKGTLTEKAIKEVFMRGGAVGGTSAGEMVLSGVNYLSGNTDNGAILRAPASGVTIIDDFLSLLPGTLAECHTNERGRIGRLPALMAKYRESSGRSVTGIAVDINTALAVDKDGWSEVMGGGGVIILRWADETSYKAEAGKPFSMRKMKYDQLLPGYRINIKTGEIQKSQKAFSWQAKGFSSCPGPVILDGSGNISDWTAAGGSIAGLISYINKTADSLVIISSPAQPALAGQIAIYLKTSGINCRIIWIDNKHSNDKDYSSSIAGAGGIIFAGNSADSLAALLSESTLAGVSFREVVNAGKPVLFLSDDVMLAGEKAVTGIYGSMYNAYYGQLGYVNGLNLIKGIQLLSRLYQNPDYSKSYDYTENRIMGMYYSMSLNRLPLGLMIDAGAYAVISGEKIEAGAGSVSATPLILIDASSCEYSDIPVFRRPGKPNAVHHGAFTNASMSIIRAGDPVQLTGVRREDGEKPEAFFMAQNYPNPFNPLTSITFSVKEAGHIILKIYDIRGSEAEKLSDGSVKAGSYTVKWNGTGFASGVYFARLIQITDSGIQSRSIKMVLAK